MPETPWTTEQGAAIAARNDEVLVAAGAGTGKTAVLVARVIGLLADPGGPADLDSILAVTFTEDAADEMKRRIRQSLEERLRLHADPRLTRQLGLLERASISTIHAFCRRLLVENFHEIGVDPQFDVLDGQQARLLQLETAEALFEERFRAEGGAAREFVELAERYGGSGGDEGLREATLRLYALLETELDDAEWLRSALARYERPELWRDRWGAELRKVLKRLAERHVDARRRLESSGAHAYLKTAIPEGERLANVIAALESSWLDDASQLLIGWEFPRASGMRSLTLAQAEAKDSYLALRDRLKKICREDAPFLSASALDFTRRAAPHAAAMGRLVGEFRERYAAAKSDQGALDFSDLERFALGLLRAGDGSPGDAARRLRERFHHVLIDECQDVNPLQSEILRLVSREEGGTRFVVGDVKQSIYGFRLAEPGIFLERIKSFSDERASPRRRIYLSTNFRSEPSILDAVNALFRRVLDAPLDGLTYSDAEALRPPAGRKSTVVGPATELVLLHRPNRRAKGGDDQAAEEAVSLDDALVAEANEIGRRVLRFTGQGEGPALNIVDRDTGQARPVRLGDMAILLRTAQGRFPIYAGALAAMGIPTASSREATFLDALETTDIVSLLSILDNPRQDIPLAAALRSPMGGFSGEALAEIRIHNRELAFHEAALSLARSGNGSETATALADFFARLDRWRTAARRESLPGLVRSILMETAYFDWVGGLPDGSQRQARLEALVEQARRFDATTRRPTLHRFLLYLNRLGDREIELTAPPPAPEGDAVPLMTIHQSKGLEFPVVFVPDLAKQFNFGDSNGDLIFARDGGLGLNEIVPERGQRRETIAKRVVAARMRDRSRAEEARLLYVALTRARERLVMLGSTDFDKSLPAWISMAGDPSAPLSADVLQSARRPLDWIGPALAALPEGKAFTSQGAAGKGASKARYKISLVRETGAGRDSSGEARDRAPIPQSNLSDPSDPTDQSDDPPWLAALRAGDWPAISWRDNRAARRIADRLAWSYPGLWLTRAPAKRAVSEWKGELNAPGEESDAVEWLPARDPLDAAARGSLIHGILQRLDLAPPGLSEAGIRRQAQGMAELGLLAGEDLEKADLQPLARFLASAFGRWLVSNNRGLRREIPFTLALPADWLEGRESDETLPGSKAILQGVIDALVQSADGLWLLDYKTDAIGPSEVEERAAAYLPQMALYSRAVASILGEPPARIALAFIAPNRIHEFDPSQLASWRPGPAASS